MTPASRLASIWVAMYTRGVPTERRDERRDELRSDLWEQEHHAASIGQWRLVTGCAIAGRVVRGLPADIAWARAQRTPRGVAGCARGVGWAAFAAATALLLLFTGSGAIRSTGLVARESWESPDERAFARGATVLFLALVAGLVLLLLRHPTVGGALVVVGALGAPVLVWCLAAVLGPAALVTTAGAIVSARGRRRALRSRSASSPP